MAEGEARVVSETGRLAAPNRCCGRRLVMSDSANERQDGRSHMRYLKTYLKVVSVSVKKEKMRRTLADIDSQPLTA